MWTSGAPRQRNRGCCSSWLTKVDLIGADGPLLASLRDDGPHRLHSCSSGSCSTRRRWRPSADLPASLTISEYSHCDHELHTLRYRDLPAGSLREGTWQVLQAAGRATALTKQLLAFSRQQALQPQILDLSAVVRDISHVAAHHRREDIELRSVLAPSIWSVKADHGQIEQVILNLVVNARDVMPEGGTPRPSARRWSSSPTIMCAMATPTHRPARM